MYKKYPEYRYPKCVNTTINSQAFIARTFLESSGVSIYVASTRKKHKDQSSSKFLSELFDWHNLWSAITNYLYTSQNLNYNAQMIVVHTS